MRSLVPTATDVFADLPKEVATQRQPTEVTWMLAALGALLGAAAVAASIRWTRIPDPAAAVQYMTWTCTD